jgi:hypothetical protein
MLAVAKQKYPKATGNQLIQSLIHNTTDADHELIRDTTNGYGYGPASLTHLLEVDPQKYPNKNPLMDKASGVPTAAQVASAAGSASPSPQPTGPANADTAGGKPGAASGLVFAVVAIGVAIVVLGIIVIAIALSRRRATNKGGVA